LRTGRIIPLASRAKNRSQRRAVQMNPVSTVSEHSWNALSAQCAS
jgi:hypothetical protein